MKLRKDASQSKMNVTLMRRVAEVLNSYEPELFRAIDVVAHGKVVTLKGRIVGDDNRKLALELARTTVGVEEVADRLAVVVRARPAPVVETLTKPEKKDSVLTRSLVLVSLLGVISSAVISMVKQPTELRVEAPNAAAVAAIENATIYQVEGTLFVEGKPAVGAQVIFHPVEEFNESTCRAIATVGPDGRFALRTLDNRHGAPAGKFAVTVDWNRPLKPGEELSPQETASLVPPRFQKPHTTPLRASIRPKQSAGDAAAVVQLPPFHVTQQRTAGRI
jgi:hypothetical protein